MNHLDESSLSNWCNDHIDDEEESKSDENFDEVCLVCEVRQGFEELILLMKDYYIRKSHLIHEDQEQPEHPYERRDKIQFLERVESRDEFPGGEDDRFFHNFCRVRILGECLFPDPTKEINNSLSIGSDHIRILDTRCFEYRMKGRNILKFRYRSYSFEIFIDIERMNRIGDSIEESFLTHIRENISFDRFSFCLS